MFVLCCFLAWIGGALADKKRADGGHLSEFDALDSAEESGEAGLKRTRTNEVELPTALARTEAGIAESVAVWHEVAALRHMRAAYADEVKSVEAEVARLSEAAGSAGMPWVDNVFSLVARQNDAAALQMEKLVSTSIKVIEQLSTATTVRSMAASSSMPAPLGLAVPQPVAAAGAQPDEGENTKKNRLPQEHIKTLLETHL